MTTTLTANTVLLDKCRKIIKVHPDLSPEELAQIADREFSDKEKIKWFVTLIQSPLGLMANEANIPYRIQVSDFNSSFTPPPGRAIASKPPRSGRGGGRRGGTTLVFDEWFKKLIHTHNPKRGGSAKQWVEQGKMTKEDLLARANYYRGQSQTYAVEWHRCDDLASFMTEKGAKTLNDIKNEQIVKDNEFDTSLDEV